VKGKRWREVSQQKWTLITAFHTQSSHTGFPSRNGLKRIGGKTLLIRVARFFLVRHTKTGKYNQTTIKYTKWPQGRPNSHKICIPTASIAKIYKIYPN
jgi:hypothetical protein